MMEGIVYFTACLIAASLLVMTRYQYVPLVTRMAHARAHVRFDGVVEIKRISGGGYELRVILELAELVSARAPGSTFALLASGGFVDLLLFDQDQVRRDRLVDALRKATPGTSWLDVDKDRVRRAL